VSRVRTARLAAKKAPICQFVAPFAAHRTRSSPREAAVLVSAWVSSAPTRLEAPAVFFGGLAIAAVSFAVFSLFSWVHLLVS
jgi:hypothetical protein